MKTLKHYLPEIVCSLIILAMLIFVSPKANAGTLVFNLDNTGHLVITQNGQQLSNVETVYTDYGEATTGGQRFQSVFLLNGVNHYVSATEGNPCQCRPGGQFYGMTPNEFVNFGLDLPSCRVVISGNRVEVVDFQPIMVRDVDIDGNGDINTLDLYAFFDLYYAGSFDADFDGDGVIGVGDVFAYLEDYFRLA